MGQWYEQPDEDAPYFGEPKGRPWAKRLFWFALMYAALAGAVVLVAMLAGCTYAGPWKATIRIEYANGQEITAGSADSGAHEGDSSFESEATRRTGASAQNAERLGRGGR